MLNRCELAVTKDGNSDIYLICSEETTVNTLPDTSGTGLGFVQLDLLNKDNFLQTFTCYVVFNLTQHKYEIKPCNSLKAYDYDKHSVTYIPFDQATDRLPAILGLLKLAGYNLELKEKK